MKQKFKETIYHLEKNNMEGYFVKDKKELLILLSRFIKKGSTVGCGDSVTLEQTGVFEFLRNKDCIFYDKHKPQLSSSEKRNLYIKNFSADSFVTSTSAVTEKGELFNIDGNGSRIAPIIYGPKQVIVVAGTNKLVPTTQEAVYRVRQVAAPLDAKRLNKKAPCVELGKCVDCSSKDRICNVFVLISKQFIKNRIKVIFIDGCYGY